ncbi:DNA primase [uncultured Pseudoalteromonas sp.]|uniref:DNA primase n=1 Tax=uncultured Pseudoalteromonas sp. TaxID=114053 RepID=UPI0030F70A26
MAGRIPQNFIDDLISRLDIVDVVSARTRLKKAGKNYSACCPFHNEKTPSFTVSPDKQFYYCFGCGATGSAVKFVMEFDGLEFPDAVEKLAGDLNIEVPREGTHQQNREPQYRELHALTQKAADFFEQQLRTSKDKDKAIGYLKDRGLSGKAAKFFSIGYAPPGWDNLQSTLAPGEKNDSTNNKTIKQLISCGMTIEKEDGRTYDRFRDRVMFPIRNVKGQVIAFGGRVLGDEKPKYLNSPETPIFHKGQELYGLYEARKIRQKLTRMVIVEGYMDVVALAEYGIHYAVATLGTATSEHHIRRLFKVVPEIIFCFDGDNAGRTAAQRAMETVIPALQDGLQARFLFLPDGEDPDTIVRKEGKDAFEKRLDNSKHLPEFVFDSVKEQVDFDTLDGKARFGQLAAPLISRLPTGMLKELMQQQLAQETGIKQEVLAKLLPTEKEKPTERTNRSAESNKISAAASNSAPQAENSSQHYGDNQYDDGQYDEHHNDDEQEFDVSHFMDTDDSVQPPAAQHSTHSKDDKQLALLTQKALTLLVTFPASAQRIEPLEDFEPEDENERLLCEILKKLKQSPQSSSIGLLILWTGTPYSEMLKNIANQPLEVPEGVDPSDDIQGILQRLHHRALRREWQALQHKVATESISKLSSEEKARYLALPKQLKKHKK